MLQEVIGNSPVQTWHTCTILAMANLSSSSSGAAERTLATCTAARLEAELQRLPQLLPSGADHAQLTCRLMAWL